MSITTIRPVANVNKFNNIIASNDGIHSQKAKDLFNFCYAPLPAYAKGAVSFTEFYETAERCKYLLANYSDRTDLTFDIVAIGNNLALWAQNKATKIYAIKGNKNYDASEPFKLVHSEDATRQLDKGIVRDAMNAFTEMEAECVRTCSMSCTMTYDIVSRWLEGFVLDSDEPYTLSAEAVEGYEALLENRTTLYGRKLVRRCQHMETDEISLLHEYEELAKVKPHAGQKTSKYIQKLLKIIFNHYEGQYDKKEFERQFAVFADGINPATFKRKMVLSVDPVDYLTMSKGNSWASCYTVNQHDWGNGNSGYHGMYSGGTWSYMNDSTTMIMYNPSSNKDNNGLAFTDKAYRQCVMFNDDDLIVHSRIYPQGCDGDSVLAKEFRQYAQNFISEMYGITNFWKSGTTRNELVWEVKNKCVEASDDFLGYDDVRHYSELVQLSIPKAKYEDFEAFLKNLIHVKAIHYGNCIYSPINGKPMEEKDGEIHWVYEDRVCKSCGCVLDDYDFYFEDNNGDFYCEDCCTYCEYHQTYEPCTNEFTEVNGYGEVCNEALEDMEYYGQARYCDGCEEWYYDRECNVFYDEETDRDYCEQCYDELLAQREKEAEADAEEV